jgi:hypothetical protein
MGQISASGYFAARQGATGACLTFNERREPAPPALTVPHGTAFAPPLTLPQGFENPNAGASPGLPGALNFSTSGQLAACGQCVCD